MNRSRKHFYEVLGLTDVFLDLSKASPLLPDQITRIQAINSLNDLRDDDFLLIESNTNAALAYRRRLQAIGQLELMPNYVPQAQDIGQVIELFPVNNVQKAWPQTWAASSEDEDKSQEDATYHLDTSDHHNVLLKFEVRTNPMTRQVTVRMILSIDVPLVQPLTIAWRPVDDERAIMICHLESSKTEASARRIFSHKEWEVLKGFDLELSEIGLDFDQ